MILPTKDRIKNYALTILLLLAIASMVWAWYKPAQVKTEYVEVPQIKVVEKIKRVEVPVEKVITIEKEKIVEKIKLPDWIVQNKDKQIIATGVIEPYEGNTDVVSVLDVKTGEGSLSASQQPMSLFGLESDKEIGVRYGFSTKGIRTDVYGKYDFLRVGRFHVGAYGEINNLPEGKAMLNISYKWR